MDNRIQDLLSNALRWSGENVNRNLYSEYQIQQMEYQKFAELIVAECARKLENDGMVEVAMELKWHFGIKS